MNKVSKRLSLAVLLTLVLMASGIFVRAHKVHAAGEGKITGSVKFTGTAPHMKGIDMSKDPYCVKAHADNPAHLETVVVGASGGLENVVLYISEGLPASAQSEVPSQVPVFDQKNCMYTPHVLAMDVNQKFKVIDQRSDDAQHSSAAQRAYRQHSVESIPAPGCGSGREELEGAGDDSRAVQHSSLDAWMVCRDQRALRYERREWRLHH